MEQALISAIAVVLALVGIFGIIVPVLPGTVLVAAGVALWCLTHQTPLDWTLLGVGLAVLAAGALSGALLTKKKLDAREIPRWPVLVGLAGGIVGIFLIPGFGLIIGFVVALFVAELFRVQDVKGAVSTSWVTIKAIGVGMLIEFACATVVTAALILRVASSW